MKFLTNIDLAPYSTIKIGGPAEYFFEAKNKSELIEAVTEARRRQLVIHFLGNGSNTLISDAGVKGLVIKNATDLIEIVAAKPVLVRKIKPRYQPIDTEVYDENQYPLIGVRLASGVYLPKAIFQLINQGITGLEWFSGIPATVGGATYINLHGADKYWSDYLMEAEILDKNNQIKIVGMDYFNYDYDQSILKTSGDLVLTVSLALRRGPKDKALNIAKYWQAKKSHQPQRSLGCIFQNLSDDEQKRLGLPTPSIGYLIDKKLGLKGRQAGQARIAVKHAGFVENLGGATASEVKQLIELVQVRAKEKLGLDLKLEVVIWPN